MKTRKKLASIVFLAVVLLLSPAIYAGNLEPSAPPGPTMKTLDEVEPRVLIHASDLPLTITEPNSYYLAENINFTDDVNNAITIEADNVTIDLMGYTLKGPDSGNKHGIFMNGRSNVEVRNGTVRDFGSHGIYEASLDNGKNHRVIGVRAVSNGGSGTRLHGFGHLVKDCAAVDNGSYGIVVALCCTVTGNTCYDNGDDGIWAGNGCTMTGNTAYGNTDYGIYAAGYCLIDQNTAYNNGTNMYTGTGCVLGTNCAP